MRITSSLCLIRTRAPMSLLVPPVMEYKAGSCLDLIQGSQCHNHCPAFAEPSNNGHDVIFRTKIFRNQSKKSIILSGNAQKQIRPKLIVEITNPEYE